MQDTTTTPTTTTATTTTSNSDSVVTMTNTKFKDVILETIDQLRQRKARPDLERISHMLQRKHGISFSETEAILGKLVDSQVVFKVDYKGSTSYRNAAKWRINHLANSSGGGGGAGGSGGAGCAGVLTPNSDQVTQRIRDAIKALAGGGSSGNSSSINSSSNNSNNISNNSNNSSNSSSSCGGSITSGTGGGRKRQQQQKQQQQNNDSTSGALTSSTTASGNKKSNSGTPNNAPNHIGESSSIAKASKKGSSNVRVDKASTNPKVTSSGDKNNNSKSPTGGSDAPAASGAATVSPASTASQASSASSRRNSTKKEAPVGVNLKDLENWLNEQDNDNPLVKNLLVTALQREVQAGWLKRLRNGSYIDVASVSKNITTKRKNANNNKSKTTTTSNGAVATPVSATTPITSPPASVSTGAIVSPAAESSLTKTQPTTTPTSPNNTNNIIIITNSANSSTNSTNVNTSPSNAIFTSQPAKSNASHGKKRSASAAASSPFRTANQTLISQTTPSVIPTSDVTAHSQQSATLMLVPSSPQTTSTSHPALLLPVSPAQTATDPIGRRTAPQNISSSATSAFSFSSSSSSLSSSISASSSGFNHNNNAQARVSLSSQLSALSGTPGLSRESATPTRRDNNNNAKTVKTGALQSAGLTNAPVPAKRGRPASKRKRFKKTPGPEFETEDILKSETEKCVNCSYTAQLNKNGQPEDLLICKDCNTTVHPSCLDYSEELALKARNSPWQCIECRTCYVCDDSGEGDSMLFCDACDKGYHMKCHVPHLEQKPKGKWVCGHCVSEDGDSLEQPMEFETSNSGESRDSSPSGLCRELMEASGPSCLPTPCDSPVQPDADEKEIGREHESISLPMLRDFQGPYPDAANWTIDDVVNFFKSAGFVSQAEAFREQEIDGKSLLLMKRSDVLTGLSLKLGPALKMYTHVQNLQLVGQSSFVNGH